MFQIEALDHVALVVRDLQQSISWYQSILGMEERYQYQDTTGYGSPTAMCSGEACIALFPSSPEYVVSNFTGHIALRLTRANFEQAQVHLHQHGIDVPIVHYPRSNSDAIYFNDPTGYQIELNTFEMK